MSIRREVPVLVLLPVLLLVLLLALGACGGGSEDGEADGAGSGSFPTLAPAQPDGEPDTGVPDTGVPDGALDPQVTADSETCALVRAGIDAFNERDFDGTVERFAEALPAAEADAAGDDATPESELLAGAVRYYAALSAEDYAGGAPATPEFETNKQITLGLCVTQDAPLAPGSPGADEPGADEPGVEA